MLSQAQGQVASVGRSEWEWSGVQTHKHKEAPEISGGDEEDKKLEGCGPFYSLQEQYSTSKDS